MGKIKRILTFVLWTAGMLATGFITGGIAGIILTLVCGSEYPKGINKIMRDIHNSSCKKDNITEFHKPEEDSVEMGFH